MVYSDLFQALVYSIMLLLLFTETLNIFILLVICCIADVVTSQFNVATNVLFSEIVKEDDLEKYNNIKSIISNLISVIAPSVGAFIYMFFGMKAIILINIISFFGSAFIEFFIEYDFEKKNKGKVKIVNELKIIIKYIIYDSDTYVKNLFLTVCILNLFSAPFTMTLLPLLIKNIGLSSSYFGISMAFFTIGSLVASFFMISFNDKFKFGMKKLVIANSILCITVGISTNLIYMGYLTEKIFIVILLASMLLMGVSITFVNIPLISGFQKLVDKDIKSKFFGVLGFVASILIPVGNFLVGVLLLRILDSNIIILFNLISIVYVLLFFRVKEEY